MPASNGIAEHPSGTSAAGSTTPEHMKATAKP
jgi:hypothetical protein